MQELPCGISSLNFVTRMVKVHDTRTTSNARLIWHATLTSQCESGLLARYL